MIESTLWNYHVREFDSVEDLISTAQRIRVSRLCRPFDRQEFVGRLFHDWDEVYAAARAPWLEGAEIIRQMAADLAESDIPKPESRRRKPRFSEADGDEVDFDRLRSGREFWRTTRRATVRGPQTVTILIDVNAMWKVDHEKILWRGAAALAMTYLLEEAGYRVELFIVHKAVNAYKDRTGHYHTVCLKRPQDPLDVATFSAAVSGWFYRSIFFAAKCVGNLPLQPNLGVPHAPNEYEIKRLMPGREVIVISGVYERAAALYVAREALKKLLTPPPPVEVEVEPEPAPSNEKAEPDPPPKPMTPAERKQQEREWKRAEKAWEKLQRQSGERSS